LKLILDARHFIRFKSLPIRYFSWCRYPVFNFEVQSLIQYLYLFIDHCVYLATLKTDRSVYSILDGMFDEKIKKKAFRAGNNLYFSCFMKQPRTNTDEKERNPKKQLGIQQSYPSEFKRSIGRENNSRSASLSWCLI